MVDRRLDVERLEAEPLDADALTRYLVFQVGPVWCIVSQDGAGNLVTDDGLDPRRVAFACLKSALVAAELVRAAHHDAGEPCEIVMLDDSGHLVTVRPPGLLN